MAASGVLLWRTDWKALIARPVQAPPFEQRHHAAEVVARLDKAIFGGLHKLGVPEERIRLLPVEHGPGDLERVRLHVGLPGGSSLEKARAELFRRLSGPEVSLGWRREGPGSGLLTVRWKGRLTHEVELACLPGKVAPKVAGPLPLLALVIDDLGYDLGAARRLIELGRGGLGRGGLTLSILPGTPHGAEIACEAREAGHETLLHLPMEAEGLDVKNLGPGALLMDQDAQVLLATLRKDLEGLPGVRGVSNHMGSRLTANLPRMQVLMGELGRKGLFFLDSRTTPRTVAPECGRASGVPVLARGVFLDNIQDPEAVAAQIAKAVSMARAHGSAVAIGHPYHVTCEALIAAWPELAKKVRLVPASKLAVMQKDQDSAKEGSHPEVAEGGEDGR